MNMDKKNDKAILKMSTSLTYIFYYSARDVLGFGQDRMIRFWENMLELKERWSEMEVTSYEMLVYCEKKGIDVHGFVKGVPNNKKLLMVGNNITIASLKYIESAMLANMMFATIVLKETFKQSTSKIKEFMKMVDNYIDSYTKKQPKSKLYYLNDRMIIDALKDEIKLDVEKGIRL